AATGHVKPGAEGWPGPPAWARLSQAVGGRLRPVSLPDLTDPAVRRLVSDPFYVSSQPGLTQSSGWLDAWRSSPSAYAVAAASAADVAAAIRFARARNVRLVVKGAGHSYLGASNAPDSLLVWTKPMDAVEVHEAFTPRGSAAEPVPAVSVGGGGIWLHAYQAVTGAAGRYVQGGGCTTVGVPGLVMGGGFGSYSKAYGTAAGSLLEAEIVTADGRVRVVNATLEPDLFWALKGGGGGTFGVVTRLTLATHPLPETFGALRLSIKATSDEAFRRLIARFVAIYAQNLCNPHWGEQVTARADNRLDVRMVFQGLGQDAARAAWRPLIDFADANKSDYEGQDSLIAVALPARTFWDAEFLRRNLAPAVRFDTRPGASPDDFWWTGDGEQVGAFWHAYESAWLPASLLEPRNQARLADAWFAASRHWSVAFHFNKGLAGAPPTAIEAARDTATNPEVLDAFALAIV
ncbi:MAG: FAD-binding protein, partial [Caulobacteraceae bacterium]